MRKPAAALASLAWFAVIGGTFGCLLPYLLNYWLFHEPLPYWWIARAVGALLIRGGMIPLAGSFVEFFKAGGTPVPVAAPPRLVVSGFYRQRPQPHLRRLRGRPDRAGAVFRLGRPGGVHRGGMGNRGRRRSPL